MQTNRQYSIFKAQSCAGEIFNIELQAIEQSFYRDRALYYWAKLYSGQLIRGQRYTELQNTYSINFLNFKLLDLPEYKSKFLILEKDHPHIQLTEKLQMVFFELPKFEKSLEKVDDNLELWLYIIRNTSSLNKDKMRIIADKNPAMQETLEELKRISIDPELLSLAEARRKAERDYNSMMHDKFRAGKAEGIAEGETRGKAEGKAEGIAEGIAEGETRGKAEGIAEGIAEVAEAMLIKGHSIPDIAQVTGLSEKELEKLKSQM